MSAIVVRDLSKSYGKVEAFKSLSLEVEQGEIFALLGPNGAGKTTLFSILSTLRRPNEGTAKVLGYDVVTQRDDVRRIIGIVFQEPVLDRRLSGFDNLRLMGLLYRHTWRESARQARRVLSLLEMDTVAERPVMTLSGGQMRKLELARALISEPKVLFLDEATLGLDVDARRSFWRYVQRIAVEGCTVFLTTHYMEEAEIANRIAMIDRGTLVAVDRPAALKARIGGGILLLRTEDDPRAHAWLRQNGYAAEQTEAGLLLLTEDPAADLPILMQEINCKVLRAEVRQSTLEDVFLTLTGRALGDAAPRGNAGRPGGKA